MHKKQEENPQVSNRKDEYLQKQIDYFETHDAISGYRLSSSITLCITLG